MATLSRYLWENNQRIAYWHGVNFNDESPYSDSICVCARKDLTLAVKEKNIFKNKSDNFVTEGYRKNDHAHKREPEDPCTPYSEQNNSPSKYSDQNTTGKDLLNKWRFMELTHVFDPKAPKQGHIYTVALKMVPYDLVVDNQRWSYSIDPDNSPIRRVRDRLRYIENTQSGTVEPMA